MAHPDLCCGSAGLYMLTEPAMSTRILDDKMRDIAEHRRHDASSRPTPAA